MNELANGTTEGTRTAVLTRLRVVLVDDHQLIRGGLKLAFDRAGGIEVVGEAGSIAEALRAAL